jgi:hypothetical protein
MLVVGWAFAAGPAVAWDVGVTTQTGQLTVYNRTADGARLGYPLASGDLNGDGLDDLVLTPMYADSGPLRDRDAAGEVAIVLSDGVIGGERDLATLVPPALPDDVTLIYGADPFDNFGTEVTVADLDGDGFDDAIVGAQYGDGVDNARPEAGEVVIVWGGEQIGGQVIDLAAPPVGAVTVVVGVDPGQVVPAVAGDRLGVWVSAGDVDGDGVADAILGADLADGPGDVRTNAGETYVLYGGAALRSRAVIDLRDPQTAVTVLYGIDRDDQSGCTVRGFDVDRDGVGDILIGAGLNRLSAASGPAGGFSGGSGSAGGDGPGNRCDPTGLNCEIGEAYVVYGVRGERPESIDLAAPPASMAVIYGVDLGDAWGEELWAGDFDGDGRGDVAIGALVADGPNNTRSAAGELALVRGDANGLRGAVVDLSDPPANVTMVYGARAGAIAGDTAMLLDLDGDGRDDLVVASPGDRALGTRVSAGTVVVLFGHSSPPAVIDLANLDEELPQLRIDGASGGDQLAYSMAQGDVNGDGLLDPILNAMGADGFDDLLPLAGDAYVLDAQVVTIVAGREVVPTRTTTPTVTPTVPLPACAGDCNGNGSADINELVTAVNIALGNAPVATCAAADQNGDGTVAINELIGAVNVALSGCS